MSTRTKMFGEGRAIPLDRNTKVRIEMYVRAKMQRSEPGKHYGEISAKSFAVFKALLWAFHNSKSGRCFPSYETIAEKADCARSTVYEAIRALERIGTLTWVNRIARIKEWGPDLFGRARNRIRVIRTSNAYTFVDPLAKNGNRPVTVSSKSELLTGTPNQDLHLAVSRTPDRENPLHQALLRLEEAIGAAPDGAARSLATK